jgi:hypothetical protein
MSATASVSTDPYAFSSGGAVGIDGALIGTVLDTFYAAVHADEMLGPVFDAAVQTGRPTLSASGRSGHPSR